MSAKGRTARAIVFVVVALVAIAILASMKRIPQPEAYHAFADTRTLWGIPNALNVLSNIPFAIVGVLGLAFMSRARDHVEAALRPAYVVFFIGVFLTAFGSGYYHLAPSTPPLFWDRLPMTISFMSLFAAVLAERVDLRLARLLFPLVALGVASAVFWIWSEGRGVGDLRPYVFVQAFPMIALPLLMGLFDAKYTRSKELLVVVFFYALAKVLEHFDGEVMRGLGGIVSGHSVKHVSAAVATYFVLDMLKSRHSLSAE